MSADMNFEQYEKLTYRTRNSDLVWEDQVANAALGISGEAGEAANVSKKHLFHGHDVDHEKMMEELGDTLWYLTWLANLYGYSLSEIAVGNIDKLRRRYPQGFDAERSRNREE